MPLTIEIDSSAGASIALVSDAAAIRTLLPLATADSVAMLRDYIVSAKLAGSPLHTRSGELARSIETEVTSDGNEATGVIGTDVRYARIQEFGGVIHARAAANLTIPLAAALTGAAPAFTAPQIISNPAIGGFARTFVRNHILFGGGPGRTVTPLFKLQPEVELPARSFFGAALDERANDILAIFESAVAGAL